MDVIQRIRDLMGERGWTAYELTKNSSLPSSTVSNIFRRNTIPSIATLEGICDAFGISLSQFFAEGERVILTPEQAELLKRWSALSKSQREAVLLLMGQMGEL